MKTSPSMVLSPLLLLGSGVTKDRGVDSETDKIKCSYIKGKSDIAVPYSRH